MKKTAIATAFILTLSGCQAPQPTPTPRYVPDVVLGEPMTLVVAPYRTACTTDKPMQCLVVQAQTGEDFGIPYNAIDGFEHHVGVSYHLIARPHIDQNNNTPLGQWTLEKIISQQPHTPK